jgi:hypothetical protein
VATKTLVATKAETPTATEHKISSHYPAPGHNGSGAEGPRLLA